MANQQMPQLGQLQQIISQMQAQQMKMQQASQNQQMQGQPMQSQPMQGQSMQSQPMQGQSMLNQPMQGQSMLNQQMQGQSMQNPSMQSSSMQSATMQSRQIANPSSQQIPQTKGPEMNERDYLNDALATCKYLTDSLNIAVREASHQQLHADMLQILNETHQSARELYNLMFQKGWYKLEAEEQQKLQQAYQQFSNYSAQFPYQ